MKTVIIVQARMTSTRLPGKILKTVLERPLLEYQIERLRRVKLADEIVIATTVNDTDVPIVELCERLQVPFFRGSEEDVLERYYLAAKEHNADAVVRITSDCPLIDPYIIDSVIGYFVDNQDQYDYVSNIYTRTYPRGMDTEVFTFKALEEACQEATKYSDREHVTEFIYLQPDRYKIGNISNSEDHSHHRWTVDTIEDFTLIKNLIEAIYPTNPRFTMNDVLQVMDKNPDWYQINADIKQKEI